MLESRPLQRLGGCSYSLYLTHSPIVVATHHFVRRLDIAPGMSTFLVTVAISVPLAVVFALWFASVFEIPFQRHRSWAAWRDVVSSARWRRQAPEMLGASLSASDESADVATTQAAALVPLKRERSGAADPIVGPDPDRA